MSFPLRRCWFGLAFMACAIAFPHSGQTRSKYKTLSNTQVQEMLDQIEKDIKLHYYDPQRFDLDSTFERARKKIASATSQNEALLYVAGAVASLNDSHTRFIPPEEPYDVDYGWVVQAVGDSNCYVTKVRPDSDAAAKGLKPGDQVLSENGLALTRQNLPYIEYGYRVFPQSGLHLTVRSTDGTQKTLVAMAKILPGQKVLHRTDVMTLLQQHAHDMEKDRSRYHKEGDVLFWRLPDFVVEPTTIGQSLDNTRSATSVVLDLRGNPGGKLAALHMLLGGFFAKDVRFGDRKTRFGSQPQIAGTLAEKAFAGKLIVLVDSRSASAAEIFARVVQLEKRGIVLGDRTAGAVTEAQFFPHAVSLDSTKSVSYAAEITEAALIMSDGGMLENVGVSPDERILPTPADISEGRDPVLARAAELAGVKMTELEAGKMFPFEWAKEQIVVVRR
jgi:C-terminal processing protease CtpA/Prc